MGGRVELEKSIENLYWHWLVIDKDEDTCVGALRYDTDRLRHQFAHCTGGMVSKTINFAYDDALKVLNDVREAYNITED